jgi:hypothetical protein
MCLIFSNLASCKTSSQQVLAKKIKRYEDVSGEDRERELPYTCINSYKSDTQYITSLSLRQCPITPSPITGHRFPHRRDFGLAPSTPIHA